LKGVNLIQDARKAKVLVDPMRREMLRLLAYREMAENQLAGTLGLSNAAVGHHLKILRQHGLIRVARRIIEKHGIVQKFYESNALFYLVDSREMPVEIERYLMPMSLERIRGMIAAANVLGSEQKSISSVETERFAKTMDHAILRVAPKYSARSNWDREELIETIYRDALCHLLRRRDLLPERIQTLLGRARRQVRVQRTR